MKIFFEVECSLFIITYKHSIFIIFNTIVSFHKHYKVIHNKSHKNIKAIKLKGNIKHIKHTVLENGMYTVILYRQRFDYK